MMEINTLFYKTTQEFCREYGLNLDQVEKVILQDELINSPNIIKGMTEMELLKKLNLWISVSGFLESDDPRGLIYIIYMYI